MLGKIDYDVMSVTLSLGCSWSFHGIGAGAGMRGASLTQWTAGNLVGEWHHTYDVDEETRHRLLAHGRQDASHAVLNTSSLLDEVLLLKRQVRRLTNMSIGTLILLVLVLAVVSLRR